MTRFQFTNIILLSIAAPCSGFVFSFTNLLYRIGHCTHPTPGPLGCKPPKCHPGSSLRECQLHSECDDGGDCDFKYDYYYDSACNGSNGCTDRFRACSDGDTGCLGDYKMCEAGDSGCIYTCDGDSCTVASSAFCAEGDEECVNFYNYYEDLADGQSNGEGNSANNVSANKASTLSVTKNVLFYLIPALFLALVIACWVRPRNKKRTKEHALKGSLKKRMKLFSRMSPPVKKRQDENHNDYKQIEDVESGSVKNDVSTKT